MTTVELRLKILCDLQESELERLRGLSTVYGIRKLQAEGEELRVEYDATRMNEAEVLALVRETGLAAELTN